MDKKGNLKDVKKGLKAGSPVGLGYMPVGFAFGVMAVNGHIPPFFVSLISLTNFTSAGQFVGTQAMIAGSSILSIAIATFVINIRYLVMGLSFSQKIGHFTLGQKLISAFAITDEVFTIASLTKHKLTFYYVVGLIIGPYVGWATGTTLGSLATNLLPVNIQKSMGIALYAMFIALLVPEMKQSKEITVVALMAILFSTVFMLTPFFSQIEPGYSIILSTIIAAAFGAALFPVKEVGEE